MNINAIELGNNVDLLNSKINELQNNQLNIVNKINVLKDIWNDGYTTSFFEVISKERNEFSFFIDDLKALAKLYNYIYKSAKKYGNKIEIEFSSVSRVLSSLNSAKQSLSSIISIYSGLDLRYTPEVASNIRSEQMKFSSATNMVDNYTNKFNTVIEYFKDLKREVTNRVRSIDVSKIDSINYQTLIVKGDVDGEVGMKDTSSIERALNNLNIEITSEMDIIDDILNIFDSLNSAYVCSANSYLLERKQSDIMVNFKVLINNHNEIIPYVNNLKNSYLELLKATRASMGSKIKGMN